MDKSYKTIEFAGTEYRVFDFKMYRHYGKLKGQHEHLSVVWHDDELVDAGFLRDADEAVPRGDEIERMFEEAQMDCRAVNIKSGEFQLSIPYGEDDVFADLLHEYDARNGHIVSAAIGIYIARDVVNKVLGHPDALKVSQKRIYKILNF